MKLHELKPAVGSTSAPKRLGRGTGSGLGKTSGKGHKGAKARSGGGKRSGFEGGQMPLFQRLPKRGFTNIFKQRWSVLNLAALNIFGEGTTVTPQLLKEAGLLKSLRDPLKILGDGELKHRLVVQAHRFSDQAKAKIEAAGGTAEVI